MSTPDRMPFMMMFRDLSHFDTFTDRLNQGILNVLMLMHFMAVQGYDADFLKYQGRRLADPAKRYYYGNSMGGILGASYMCYTTEVERGVLGVAGAPFSLLFGRSTHNYYFGLLLNGLYADPLEAQLILGLIEILWEKAEPGGCMSSITDNPLPGTPPHRVLMQSALADKQVSEVGSHKLARSLKARLLAPPVRGLYGLPAAEGPLADGSALVEYDFNLPPIPLENVPPLNATDSHEFPRRLLEAQEQLNDFLAHGVLRNYCRGACDPN